MISLRLHFPRVVKVFRFPFLLMNPHSIAIYGLWQVPKQKSSSLFVRLWDVNVNWDISHVACEICLLHSHAQLSLLIINIPYSDCPFDSPTRVTSPCDYLERVSIVLTQQVNFPNEHSRFGRKPRKLLSNFLLSALPRES